METIATLTLNKSSQTTIPKKVREILGVNFGDRLSVRRGAKKNEIILSREPSLKERLDAVRKKWDARLTEEEKLKRKKLYNHTKNMTAREIRAEWDNSPEGKTYYAKKYGENA